MIKRRNPLLQALLWIVTLTLYTVYWFYVTFKEMAEHNRSTDSAVLWTVLALISLVGYWAYWKHATLVDQTTDGRLPRLPIFLLGVFLLPGYWIVTQLELNKVADGQAPVAPAPPAPEPPQAPPVATTTPTPPAAN